MVRLLALVGSCSLLLLACSNDSCCSDSDVPDPNGSDVDGTPEPDADAAVAADAVDSSEPDTADSDAADAPSAPLRPNVQADVAPNAVGQTPAFAEQTRRPQPAEPTAFTTEVLAEGLVIPWGIAPLPDGRLLVTEREGRLRVVDVDGTLSEPVIGVPAVTLTGQGGLLDVAIGPNFANDRAVFLTFVEARDGGTSATAVARGALSPDGSRLDGVTVIYRLEPPSAVARHYGSRLVFDRAGALFVTFGDRGESFEDAQSPFNGIGAVIRIWPDGSIPDDNPFADGNGGDPAVWSWGHRNIQAATLDLDGALWTVEHGPRGGDELNRPEPGVNYGWPIISYGEDYGGQPVGAGATAREGLAQPVYFWDPVIAPSGMATYSGELFAGWEGDLLVGGLQAQALVRLTMREGRVYTEEWLPLGVRVRSVAIANDGAVLVGTDAGEIVVLRPE